MRTWIYAHFSALLWFCSFLMIGLPQVQATHIVGGEINYHCLGNNQYEIKLIIFRDCDSGQPWFDGPAVIGVYYGQSQILFQSINVAYNPAINDTIPIVLADSCLTISSSACIHTTTYRTVINLPFDPRGYTLVYQRCCRNIDIVNIVDPDDAGASYWTYMSPASLNSCNSSPAFDELPRVYLCSGIPVHIDNGATDLNNDSIVYELCTPSDGDFSSSPRPRPPGPPPYDTVVWKPPYSRFNMLGGPDPLRIDPQTGLTRGTPAVNGVFLVGVCIREYRDGQLMSIVRRDFQHIVGPCRSKATADFATVQPRCNTTLNYVFNNRSQLNAGGGYLWTFDTLGTAITTTGSYIFPDTGTYTITLVAGTGTFCQDTTSLLVDARIEAVQLAPLAPIVACIGDTVSFSTINTLAGYADTTFYNWSPQTEVIAGQGTSTGTYIADRDKTIQILASNNYGCTATTAANIITQAVNANFSFIQPPCNENLTISFQNQSTSTPITNSYQWDFGGVGTSNNTNPTFTFPDTGDYTIQLIVGGNTRCPDTFDITSNFQIRGVDLQALPDLTLCRDATQGVRLINNLNDYSNVTNYVWSPLSVITNGQGTDSVTIIGNSDATIRVVTTNNFGCTDSLQFNLRTVVVDAAFDTVNLACNTSLLVPFVNRSTSNVGANDYQWDAFGVGSSTLPNPTFAFPDTGNYTVQLVLGRSTLCPDTATFDFYLPLYGVDLQPLIAPTVCVGDSVWIRVEDALANYSNSIQYTWSPNSAVVTGQGTDSVLIIPSNTTTIRVDALNSHLCPDSIETTIAVQIVEAAFDSVDLICNTSLVLPFINRSTSNLSRLDYSWQASSAGTSTLADPTFVFPDTGTYTVQLIAGTNSICPDTLKQRFRLPLEGVLLEAPDVKVFCKGDTVLLTVVDSLERFSTSIQYTWLPSNEIISGQGNDTALAFLNQPNQVYRVIGINNFGCIDTTELIGTIQYPWPILAITSNPDSIFIGQSAQLLATNNLDYTYAWVPDTTLSTLDSYNPIAKPRQTQWYTLTVTNSLGCTTTDSILINIKAPICGEPVLFVPNAFSPDGDGYNDVFLVNGNNITDMTMEIYNRWGQRVFVTNNQSTGWDGRFQGAELPPDVYGYYVRCVCDDGSIYFKKGNVTLLR